MDLNLIESTIRGKIGQDIRLSPMSERTFRVLSPFQFEDGDHFNILLRQENGGWVFSDEGTTFLHLMYDVEEKDFRTGTRQRIISDALDYFRSEERDGELIHPVVGEDFGKAFFCFIQALCRIAGVTNLSREVVHSTFVQDCKNYVSEFVPEHRREFDWHHPAKDPRAIYPVDIRINETPKPVFIYLLPTDSKTKDATISLLQFERWGLDFVSLGVFEDEEKIGRKVLARFGDVCGKLFSNLDSNRDRVQGYITRHM